MGTTIPIHHSMGELNILSSVDALKQFSKKNESHQQLTLLCDNSRNIVGTNMHSLLEHKYQATIHKYLCNTHFLTQISVISDH